MKPFVRILFATALILLAACAPAAATETPPAATAPPVTGGQAVGVDQITNINWQWTQLQETQPASQSVVAESAKYTLVLTPDGNFSFTADCNSGSGTYTSEGTNLTLTLGPVTLAECGPESLSSNYISLLGEVTAFGKDGDQLRLTVSDGTAFMGFSVATANAAAAAAIDQLAPAAAPDNMSVKLDTQNVFPAYEAKLVAPTAYDTARAGLPEHTEVTFGQPVSPILYIIPVDAYKKLWDSNDNPLVSNTLAKFEDLLSVKPTPFNTCCMPVLPVESAGGLNDIVAQGAFLPTQVGEGMRFVGRFAQDANPVANGQFYYVFQGLSSDHRYLVSLFYPVTSSKIPNRDQVPQSEIDQMMQDPQAYAAQKAQELNALSPEDWSPSLTALDALIASLQFTPTTP